jgi:Phytanoyl-CoA dioxygenase (PhyH)
VDLGPIIDSVRESGFAVLERRLDNAALVRTHRSHLEALAAADPRDTARSASGRNTRTYLPAHHRDLDWLYLDPALLSIAAHVLQGPFKLSAFLSRTVHPGANAQTLHADMARERDVPAMLGFIYMLDDFRSDNGATRFVPGSHRGLPGLQEVVVAAPAGSLLVYDGAVLYGFSDHKSERDRGSIQGAFVLRSTPAVVDRPWRCGRNDLARYLLGNPTRAEGRITLKHLANAMEASWDHRTAHQGETRAGNPAFGQCYPTSRVVQWFFPEYEIACGDVWIGSGIECHFWNVHGRGEERRQIDLSWQQFPTGSVVRTFKVLDRATLDDSPATVERCTLLLQRVLLNLADRGLLSNNPHADCE